MKSIKTAVIAISSLLLLSINAGVHADAKIESIDGCVITTHDGHDIRIVNLERVDAIMHSNILPDDERVVFVSGGEEIASVLHLTAKKVKELTDLYKKCAD